MPEISREDYTRRRRKVMRRLNTLSKNKTYSKGAIEDIDYLRRRLPPVSEIKGVRNFKMAFHVLEVAENSDLYSVRGRRRIDKRKIATLKSHGVNITSHQELNDFSDFMEEMRDYAVAHVYDSTKAAEIFNDNKGKSTRELKELYLEWQNNRSKGR